MQWLIVSLKHAKQKRLDLKMRRADHLGGITAFVTTAQHGSFTAAAEKLRLTKSAVGKSVGRLEERLGLKLFHTSSEPHT